MSIRYETILRNGHTLDVLTDTGNGLRIVVSRRGAELVSLTRQDANGEWIGFLWRDGDVSKVAEGWNNHATVMGYYIHRIKNERTVYRGHEMHGGTHSFLRHKDFDAPLCDLDAHALTYRMGPEQIAPEEYPFKVAFSLTYALQHGQLRVTFHFENQEPELDTHVSFGLHPGFGASSLDAAEVLMPPGEYVRHFAPENFLSGETETFQHAGGPMPFRKVDLPGSFLLELKNVPQPIFVFSDAPSHRQVELDFREAPYMTLWSNGQPFICIEPCWGLPDHHEQRPFENKLGIQKIPPQGTLTHSFTITPEILA
jgi:galactose mutarotase-like enzyme